MFRKFVPTFFILVLALTACGQKPATPFSVESLNGKLVTLVSYFKNEGDAQLTITLRTGSRTETVAVNYFVFLPVDMVNDIHVLGKSFPFYNAGLAYAYYPADHVFAESGQFPGSFTGNAYVEISNLDSVTFFVTEPYTLTDADKKINRLQSEYISRRAAKANLIGAKAIGDGQTVTLTIAGDKIEVSGYLGGLVRDDNPYGLIPGQKCENLAQSFEEWGTDKDLPDWYAVCGQIAYLFGGLSSDYHFPLDYGLVYDDKTNQQLVLLSFAFAQLPDEYELKDVKSVCGGQSVSVGGQELSVGKMDSWVSRSGLFLFDGAYNIGNEVHIPANGWLVVIPEPDEGPFGSYTVYHLCSK